MVKGWEARAELANKRRQEARQRKQDRKGPKKVTGTIRTEYTVDDAWAH